jgi:hypothetical protein
MAMEEMSAAAAAAVVGDGGELARCFTALAALAELTTSPRVVSHPPRGGAGGDEMYPKPPPLRSCTRLHSKAKACNQFFTL